MGPTRFLLIKAFQQPNLLYQMGWALFICPNLQLWIGTQQSWAEIGFIFFLFILTPIVFTNSFDIINEFLVAPMQTKSQPRLCFKLGIKTQRKNLFTTYLPIKVVQILHVFPFQEKLFYPKVFVPPTFTYGGVSLIKSTSGCGRTPLGLFRFLIKLTDITELTN